MAWATRVPHVDQRHEWFREGARAFRAAQRLLGREHFLPSDEDLYACPLCLKYIFRIGAIETGDLTREHAPPESLGGKKLALTCRWCNNDSGKHFDAEAQKQERLRLIVKVPRIAWSLSPAKNSRRRSCFWASV